MVLELSCSASSERRRRGSTFFTLSHSSTTPCGLAPRRRTPLSMAPWFATRPYSLRGDLTMRLRGRTRLLGAIVLQVVQVAARNGASRPSMLQDVGPRAPLGMRRNAPPSMRRLGYRLTWELRSSSLAWSHSRVVHRCLVATALMQQGLRSHTGWSRMG